MNEEPKANWLPRESLQLLIDLLRARDYRVLGPVLRDGGVVLDEVSRVDQLPIGWRDVQEPGRWRLERDDPERVFGVLHGHSGLKALVFAPREPLLQVRMEGPGSDFSAEPILPEMPATAVIGARACDLAALAVQDRVFDQDRYPDPHYGSRRRRLLIVAVQCTRSVSTCFCTSMGTGPEVTRGYDLALTELSSGFVVRAGSPEGGEILEALRLAPAPAERCVEERRAIEQCAREVPKRLDTGDLPDLLYDRLDHDRWDDVAGRCLSCGNCTMVCPTCFCHDQRDEPELDGRHATRVREWDSCFDRAHAQVHGVNFRPHVRERYRQWLVHKFASWIDQFGTSGCVGCGRCISWCPVGIDPTEEIAAIRGAGHE